MELTEGDLGKTFLWTMGEPVELIDFNPAADDEVLVRPEFGGHAWVHKAQLFPIGASEGSESLATDVLIGISANLVAYEGLKGAVRQLLEALDNPPPRYKRYVNDMSDPVLDVIDKLRECVGVPDPLDD